MKRYSDPSESLSERFARVRSGSKAIAAPLSPEDCLVQPALFASPAAWHLGHTTWFFEQFILSDLVGYQRYNPDWDVLFNSYYESLGERVARDRRGLQSRPGLNRILDFRTYVDTALIDALEHHRFSESQLQLLELGLNHEEQHQELMWYDLKYLLGAQALTEPYARNCHIDQFEAGPSGWIECAEGIAEIGFSGEGFTYDNESPRHRQYLPAGQLSTSLVSNQDYLEFIDAGGYRDPLLWHSEGWAWRQRESIEHPLYWRPAGAEGWQQYRLSGVGDWSASEAVSGISWFEAAAFCRWAGWDLPAEGVWESAVRKAPDALNTGQLWEFTGSAYLPYPGYRAASDAAGEYNGKFMVNQMVLKGASRATPPGHSRPSYRNFYAPEMRWMFAGIRPFRYRTEP
ncbi:ergothioneine biosynthesis protein EgtB [bacterium]|nr:ergothioneine biosynthesis protein EgtB [bacterium]